MAKSKGFNDLPWIVRLILALPVFDSLYGIHRILRGHLIAGLIWIFAGWGILWIVDIICVILYGKVKFFAD